MTVVRLLHLIETLNEFRTGKPCKATVDGSFMIGFGYHSTIVENAKVEYYLFPFTRVSIYTWSISGQPINTASHA